MSYYNYTGNLYYTEKKTMSLVHADTALMSITPTNNRK